MFSFSYEPSKQRLRSKTFQFQPFQARQELVSKHSSAYRHFPFAVEFATDFTRAREETHMSNRFVPKGTITDAGIRKFIAGTGTESLAPPGAIRATIHARRSNITSTEHLVSHLPWHKTILPP